MASPVRPIVPRLKPTASPRQPAALTDDLLEEIFLHIASPTYLARASAACVSFRRLIADPTFLRRYHSLHPPLLLGFVDISGFQPAEAPHPSSPAARALARAAGFSFRDYLPRDRGLHWYLRDVRNGRLLLENYANTVDEDSFVLPDLAVCDPLSRQYLLLPPIPDGLLASVQVQEQDLLWFEAFLIPCRDEEDETSFRVIGVTKCMTKLVVFVVSSGSGCWSIGMSTTWDARSLNVLPESLSGPQYAYGCFYWKVGETNKLLKLDINRMELSTVDLPPDHDQRYIAIVEAGEGRLAMFSQICGGAPVYYYTFGQNEGERTNEWQMENRVPLPSDFICCIDGALEGYVFLRGTPKVRGMVGAMCFSLDTKTLKVERVSRIRHPFHRICPYFGFPPSMSPRRIQGYEVN